LPGAYYGYAMVMAVLGETRWAIRVGLLAASLTTALFIFLLGRQWIDALGGVVAAGAFLLLAVDRWTMGGFAHATHFAALPAVAGLWALQSTRGLVVFAGGVLLGAAVLIKQHAGFFLLFALVIAACPITSERPLPRRVRLRRAVACAAGAAVPFVLALAVLSAQDSLGRMWFWLVEYAREYITINTLADAPEILMYRWRTISQATWGFWMLGGAGLLTLCLRIGPRGSRMCLAGLVGASALAIAPGFYFRPHYFILAAPAVALLAGRAVSTAVRAAAAHGRAMALVAALLLFAGAAATYVARERDYLFSMSPHDVIRSVYGGNPFLEAIPIAAYIAARTTPADTIAVLGSEPEIYFYAARRAATGYIYAYPLVEPQRYASRMQDEAIRDIEGARPAYVVHVGIGSSWGIWPGADRRILAWIPQFLRSCYHLVGVVDIVSPDHSVILWDTDARGYQPRTRNLIHTYRRRSGAGC